MPESVKGPKCQEKEGGMSVLARQIKRQLLQSCMVVLAARLSALHYYLVWLAAHQGQNPGVLSDTKCPL